MHLKYAYLNNREWKIDVCIYCSRYNDFINVNPFNSAKQRNLCIYLFLILPTHPKTAVYSDCYTFHAFIYTYKINIYTLLTLSRKRCHPDICPEILRTDIPYYHKNRRDTTNTQNVTSCNENVSGHEEGWLKHLIVLGHKSNNSRISF